MPPLPGTQANNLHGTFLIAYFLVCYLRTCDIYTVSVSLFSLVWVVWVSRPLTVTLSFSVESSRFPNLEMYSALLLTHVLVQWVSLGCAISQ